MTRLPITFNAVLAGAVRRRSAEALRRLQNIATECGMTHDEFVTRACKGGHIEPVELGRLLDPSPKPASDEP